MTTAAPDRNSAERKAFEKRRRTRNIAVGVALAAFVVLIYFVTVVKIDLIPGSG